METFILLTLVLLGILAVCDLFVGVSNDAVNFLNSAVGSKAAPFWIIMAVACAGVLLGATFSSGMMEVAKTGVLIPENYTFREVIVVFAAVMVTDVLLLNTFNSLGLPTSTTVSIIFELLGGAVAMACYKVWQSGAPFTDLGNYLNSGKALAMILAILVSVLVAFLSGVVVQWLLRLVFTFRYERIYKWLGGVFAGVAFTAIFYFLVMKGAKGASFMRPEWIEWMNANTQSILITSFLGCTVFFQACILLFRLNIFPYVILAGTFALAFAFAGNDLVNFIGVPMAALDSWTIFSAVPGADPDSFLMGGLREVTHTPTYILLGAGLVMVLTLCFSKKAHTVIRTSINLSSSSRGGKEQFGSSLPARMLVRGAIHANDIVHQIIPKSVFRVLDKRFEQPKHSIRNIAFDEVRASVNLVLAAALIASATSLKLPLSTTYVTFMVAMGSSLADGAWDRESAVYRVSGVLTVISGWFITAFTAATACGLVTMLFESLGEVVMIAGMLLALFLIVRTNFFAKEEKEARIEVTHVEKGDRESIRALLSSNVQSNLTRTLDLFTSGLDAFLAGDYKTLARLKGDAATFFDLVSLRRGEYYRMALTGGGTKADRDARNFYYRAYSNMKEVSHALRDQLGISENYVANSHSPFTGRMRDNIEKLSKDLRAVSHSFVPADCARILGLIEEAQREFMEQIAEEQISLRKSELYLGYLLFAREVLNRYLMVKLLQSELEGNIPSMQGNTATTHSV